MPYLEEDLAEQYSLICEIKKQILKAQGELQQNRPVAAYLHLEQALGLIAESDK